MKRILFLMLFTAITLFCIHAQTKTNKEPPFNGTSAQAAEWIDNHDSDFRKIASDVSKVVTYSGTTNAGGNGVALLYYDYVDLPKGRMGTVLEIIDNASGNVIYVVWTNEARGDNAVFFRDAGKTQLDVSVASRGRKYGMSNDTLKYVRAIIQELK